MREDAAEITFRCAVAEAAVRAEGSVAPNSSGLTHAPIARLDDYREAASAGPYSEAGSYSDIEAILRRAYPQDRIIGEESGLGREEVSRCLDRCWLIDPLNGPVDYDQVFPVLGPAVAYVVNGKPVVAAVRIPAFDDVITAVRGRGAARNGKALWVASSRPLDRAMVVTNIPDIPSLNPALDVKEAVRRLHGWRMPSKSASPLVSMCYLAAGRIDAFAALPASLGPWDLGPGALIVEEAGGVVAGHLGAAFDLMAAGVSGSSSATLLDELWEKAGVVVG